MLPHQILARNIIGVADYLGIDPTYLPKIQKLRKLDSNARERAKKIPQNITPLADIFALQEAFDTDARTTLIEEMKRNGVPYSSGIQQRSSLYSLRLTNSGLITLSKFPITNIKNNYYQDSFKNQSGIPSINSDRMADKGVLYTRIEKNNKPYHILSTHLQSRTMKAAGDIRLKQLTRLSTVMDAMNIPQNEPVFIVGDFNIDSHNKESRPDQQEEYKRLFEHLDVTPVLPKKDQPPYTAPFNQSQTERFNSEGEVIDHIFYSNKHRKPTTAYLTVEKQLGSLSDHYPIVGHFEFEGY